MIAQPDFHAFDIRTEEMSSWNLSAKVYNFFEIIHIIDGQGERYFNHMRQPYRPGQLLIYTPQDCRSFIINEPTRFLFIRFSDVLFANCLSDQERNKKEKWLKDLEYLFLSHNREGKNPVNTPEDCGLIKNVMAAIAQESAKPQLHYRDNVQHLLEVLLNIFTRNVTAVDGSNRPDDQNNLIAKLTAYIRRNIYAPDRLTIAHLAGVAGVAASYVGEFFKTQTGKSVRQYITEHRLQLIKVRLEYTDLSLSEIAHELSFSDESHMSNLFRKHTGTSPSNFRRAVRAASTAIIDENHVS
ncbi:helix-turn-helix domain-containing protein [Mucilaginibacter sp. HD30]